MDAANGKFVVSIAVHCNPSPRPYPNSELIAPPWVTDKAIIAAYKHEVVAMPLPKELQAKANGVTD